jgi:hypothetical protein
MEAGIPPGEQLCLRGKPVISVEHPVSLRSPHRRSCGAVAQKRRPASCRFRSLRASGRAAWPVGTQHRPADWPVPMLDRATMPGGRLGLTLGAASRRRVASLLE